MKYWQKVRVTSWFYEGMEGNLLEKELQTYRNPFTIDDIWIAVRYTVQVHNEIFWDSWVSIPESSLELIQ